ncbi:MAG: DUF2281 domain-containing protein [Saprospiraceae bacterium]|nr:DUF2281 domain-containing protein [Saprospiraceae bacterium]MCF8249643.1 DUF2281 domain-containing protein [Saprospiraceae bacterium]MCF8280453.1 DUF2281 domain-containing protein [Bacteroidales bacterium]MCF8310475.1 DUF2281 domain-containing protein [Saprospiraceae bacterium]MCF8439853.1 DUF2281 domain-containing protein [Saprospiraceae bacterium]
MSDQIIFTQLQQLPDALKKEVMDFIGFLLEKHRASSQPTGTPKQPKKGKATNTELEEAIKIVQAGCDMSSFGGL